MSETPNEKKLADDIFEEFQGVTHPDDLFFKKVMSRKTSVEAYLKHFATDLSNELDLTSLEHSSDTFIDKELKLFESDIVYRCRLKDSETVINISFLWEHKSSPETYVAIQMGLYLFLALHKMSKEKGRKLEIIIPFLFYNGAKNWKPKTIHDLFKKTPKFDSLKAYVPQFQFMFKNVVKSSDRELLMIQDAFFRSAMFAMASRNNAKLIIERISRILDINSDGDVMLLLNYILHFTIQTDVDLRQAIITSESPLKNKIMSTIEQMEEKYTSKGVKIGVEKGELKKTIEVILRLNEKKFSAETIADVVGQSVEFVNEIIGREEII